MDRASQLTALESSLRELLQVLALDPECQWQSHFERSLAWAQHLRDDGFTQADLNELSGSVMHVYGGHSSFNDYAPLRDAGNGKFRLIPGAERFSQFAGGVYQNALSLRVLGNAF